MNQPTKTETLLGGAEFQVQFRDGKTENVIVRQVPLRQMKRFALAVETVDDAALVELVCAKDAQWSDNLTPKSSMDLVRECRRVNADFFQCWAAEKVELRATLEALGKATSPSPISQPSAPSSAA
jgi:hypothetical protein